jgi:hypothetical protein
MQLVCVALRDAVAQHWRRLCLARLAPLLASNAELVAVRLERLIPTNKSLLLEPSLPQCIVASDWRQWCALFDCLARKSIRLCIVGADATEVHFCYTPSRRTRWGKISATYCTRERLDRALVQFSFNGRLILDLETIQELLLPQDAVVDATVVQAGA